MMIIVHRLSTIIVHGVVYPAKQIPRDATDTSVVVSILVSVCIGDTNIERMYSTSTVHYSIHNKLHTKN
jgi:hypothetical protein